MTSNVSFSDRAFLMPRGARLATRNVRDFVDCAIMLVNPWGEA